MARIFISHSSFDNAEATALCDWLNQAGWNDLFLDLDPVRGIVAGERWEQALHKAANYCEAVLILGSRNWLRSRWCLRELSLAMRLNKRIFCVLIDQMPLSELPVELTDAHQIVSLWEGNDHLMMAGAGGHDTFSGVTFSRSGLASLKTGLMRAGLDAKYFAWPPASEPHRSPYRGLKALEAEDAGVYFGRDAQIVEAIDQLRGLRDTAPPRAYAILGASGAGKSSFLRAGLIPRLSRDQRNYIVLPCMRPEGAALTGDNGFLRCLERAARLHRMATTRSEIRHIVEGGAESVLTWLAALSRRATVPDLDGLSSPRLPRIILAIDQVEELFNSDGKSEAAAFLALLDKLLRSELSPVMLIVSIGSDSFDSLQSAPQMSGLRIQTFSLPTMPRGSYQTVIEGPSGRSIGTGRSLEVEPALTSAILSDLEEGSAKDALPLLAFTLQRLFEEYDAGETVRLTLSHYRALGGLRGSIEAAVNSLVALSGSDPVLPRDEGERLGLLRQALIPALAGVDPETGYPRRRTARLCDIPAPSRPLIPHMVAARLLSADRSVEDGERTLELAHDSLLRQWDLLNQWLHDDQAALTTLQKTKAAARDWETNGHDEAWLIHSAARLEDAELVACRADFANVYDPSTRSYLDTARRAEDMRKQREDAEARALATALAFSQKATDKLAVELVQTLENDVGIPAQEKLSLSTRLCSGFAALTQGADRDGSVKSSYAKLLTSVAFMLFDIGHWEKANEHAKHAAALAFDLTFVAPTGDRSTMFIQSRACLAEAIGFRIDRQSPLAFAMLQRAETLLIEAEQNSGDRPDDDTAFTSETRLRLLREKSLVAFQLGQLRSSTASIDEAERIVRATLSFTGTQELTPGRFASSVKWLLRLRLDQSHIEQAVSPTSVAIDATRALRRDLQAHRAAFADGSLAAWTHADSLCSMLEAEVCSQSGETAQAKELATISVNQFRDLCFADYGNLQLRNNLASLLLDRAGIASSANDTNQVAEDLTATRTILVSLRRDGFNRNHLAPLLFAVDYRGGLRALAQKDYERAHRFFQRVIVRAKSLAGEGLDPRRAASGEMWGLLGQVTVLAAQKRFAEAEASAADAFQKLEQTFSGSEDAHLLSLPARNSLTNAMLPLASERSETKRDWVLAALTVAKQAVTSGTKTCEWRLCLAHGYWLLSFRDSTARTKKRLAIAAFRQAVRAFATDMRGVYAVDILFLTARQVILLAVAAEEWRLVRGAFGKLSKLSKVLRRHPAWIARARDLREALGAVAMPAEIRMEFDEINGVEGPSREAGLEPAFNSASARGSGAQSAIPQASMFDDAGVRLTDNTRSFSKSYPGLWRTLDFAEMAERTPQLCRDLPPLAQSSADEVVRMRAVELPFYPGAELIESQFLRNGEVGVVAAVCRAGRLVWLNGTSPPIKELNKSVPLSIETPDTATAYIHFFTTYLYAEIGVFQIVESPGDLSWTWEAPPAVRQKISGQIKPMIITRRADNVDCWRASALVQYGQTLFWTVLGTPLSGDIEMHSNEAVGDDLPLVAPIYQDGVRVERSAMAVDFTKVGEARVVDEARSLLDLFRDAKPPVRASYRGLVEEATSLLLVEEPKISALRELRDVNTEAANVHLATRLQHKILCGLEENIDDFEPDDPELPQLLEEFSTELSLFRGLVAAAGDEPLFAEFIDRAKDLYSSLIAKTRDSSLVYWSESRISNDHRSALSKFKRCDFMLGRDSTVVIVIPYVFADGRLRIFVDYRHLTFELDGEVIAHIGYHGGRVRKRLLSHPRVGITCYDGGPFPHHISHLADIVAGPYRDVGGDMH